MELLDAPHLELMTLRSEGGERTVEARFDGIRLGARKESDRPCDIAEAVKRSHPDDVSTMKISVVAVSSSSRTMDFAENTLPAATAISLGEAEVASSSCAR